MIGFDSAWTAGKQGAIVGALRSEDGLYHELGPPQAASFEEATKIIRGWQSDEKPTRTIVMLDQPTVVRNSFGQRPVENLVSSVVGRLGGGVQPSSTKRAAMFGASAPIHAFLKAFGGAANPAAPVVGTYVLETYPVLSLVELGWTNPDGEGEARLPKYNPQRKTFKTADAQFVRDNILRVLPQPGFDRTRHWLRQVEEPATSRRMNERKADQDGIDACLCLLVGVRVANRQKCLLVGSADTGYMVVQNENRLRSELVERREEAGWDESNVSVRVMTFG